MHYFCDERLCKVIFWIELCQWLATNEEMIMSTTPADDSLENISRILLQGEVLESQLLAYPEWQIVHLDGT